MIDSVTVLRTPETIRDRCNQLLACAEQHQLLQLTFHPEQMDAAAAYVASVTREQYPDLAVPYHDRWGHLNAGGVPRVQRLAEMLSPHTPAERLRRSVACIVVSVLLDAGAGPAWRYRDATSGIEYSRSEGLAVASFDMFQNGLFSATPGDRYRIDSSKLAVIQDDDLAAGFQVTPNNPLVGLSGRAELLRKLGRTTSIHEFADRILERSTAKKLSAAAILQSVLETFEDIWPSSFQLNGHNMGDVARHPLVRGLGDTDGIVPFHKLSQWLTYSLILPFEQQGYEVTELSRLTPLAEYRNGGLLVDLGVIQPRDAAAYSQIHAVTDELVVEWRALTIAIIDRLAVRVREMLHVSEESFPLPRVLQGGTWSAGRLIARQRRPDGAPPFSIKSDGNVF